MILKKIGCLAHDKLLNLGLPLAVLLVFTPFFPGLSTEYGIAHPARIMAIWMAIVAAVIAFRKGLSIKPHSLDIFFVGFVISVIGSLIIEGSQHKTQGFVYVISVMLVPYAFARLLTQSDIKVFVFATVWLALILVLVCVFGISRLDDFEASRERLFVLGWPGPGVFGLTVGMLVPVSVAFILSGMMHKKSLMAWLTIPIAMWIVVTLGARSSFVSGLSASFIILILAYNVSVKWRLSLASFLSICAIISLVSLPDSRLVFFSKLATFTTPTTPTTPRANLTMIPQDCYVEGESVAIRSVLYKEAIILLEAHPVFGVGAGNYGLYSCFKNQRSLFAGPHSTVLHVQSELGLVGGLLFFGIFMTALVGLVQRMWNDDSEGENLAVWILAAMWIYYFIADQFLHSYFTIVHFFVLAGVAASLLAKGRLGLVGGQTKRG